MLTDADVAAEHVTLLILLRRPEANPLPCFFSLLFLTFF
jgi:hypothetical protein